MIQILFDVQVENCKRYGANVIIQGVDLGESR